MSTHHQTLTRARMKEALHHKFNLPLDQAHTILESILNETIYLITHASCLKIVSFGTFLIHEKKARSGRNPKTKQEVVISPRKSVSFRAATSFRSKVNL